MVRGAFRPWLEERILSEDDDLLVVDKPSGLPVHGGDERLPGDVVSRLAERFRSRGESSYLGVHQRLDVGTSGVLLFVRRPELNGVVAKDFESGAVEKEYVAAVRIAPRSPLVRERTLELVHQVTTDGRRTRVVRSGGKLCKTGCRVLARREDRALLALRPETGRTHQLRVQLAAIHAPIAGDRDYGGSAASRLLLHARALSIPSLGRVFTSREPALLERFLHGDTDVLGAPTELRQTLADAAALRYPLLAQTQAFRWVNGWGDHLPGLVVDWYAGYATLSVLNEQAMAREAELGEHLRELGASSVHLKRRPRADIRLLDRAELAPATPLIGTAPGTPLIVRENGALLEILLGDGLSTGLFVDQRDNRKRLMDASRDASVLNLFSYTGAFSVAAALGGARRVTSVDTSGRALERAKHNFVLNGLDPEAHAFVRLDVIRYLTRQAGRAERFDWIVLDPPSFSSAGSSGVLRVERDYARLLELSLAVLAPGGRLLAVTNHRKTSHAALRALARKAAQKLGRDVIQVKELLSGLDCPDGAEGPEPSRAVLVTVR